MRTTSIVPITVLAFGVSSVWASEQSYEIEPLLNSGWQPSSTPLEEGVDPAEGLSTGLGLNHGSLNFGALVRENIFVWGDYTLGQFRFEDEDQQEFDLDTRGLGLGLKAPLLPKDMLFGVGGSGIDLLGGLSVEQLRLDLNDVRSQDLGYGLSAGLRAALTPRFEFNTGVKYADFGRSTNSFKYTVGTSYSLTPEFSVNLDYARNIVDLNRQLEEDLIEVDDDVFTIGFRYLFGDIDEAESRKAVAQEPQL
jgi:opacity protein-like surface antigen